MGEMRKLARNRCSLRLACALLSLCMVLGVPLSAFSQEVQKPSSPAATGATTAAPSPATAAPRTRIELSPAERQALDGTNASTRSTAPIRDELLPTADDAQALQPAEERQTVIEQVRTPNRTTEIRVTPALTGRTYTMTTREGRQPLSATGTSPGLSVPKFFTFEFGGTEERPAPTLPPPPPSSSTPR
jgi:hypothetical protein